MGTIIEGESLLNDGAAIVLFNVLLIETIPGDSQTGQCYDCKDNLYTITSILFTQHLRFSSTSSELHLVALHLATSWPK